MNQPVWTIDGSTVTHPALMARLAASDAVLLGEQHDRADHHRWQLYVAAGLLAHRPIVMGFEMFPARVDPVLAEWVAGALSDSEFLEQVGWGTVWGFPPELYLPLFRFCRDMRVPMVGLNVARDLVRATGAQGWDALPEALKEGLSAPCPSPDAYRRFVFDLTGGARPDRVATSADDPAFDRFIRAQEVWDRAFAIRLQNATRLPGAPLAVGIIGMGHLQFGGGVPWQMADLGLRNVQVLIPQDAGTPYREGAADAVCTLPAVAEGLA